MNLRNRKLKRWISTFCLSFLLFQCCTLIATYAQFSVQLQKLLNKELPSAMESGLQSRLNQQGELEQLLDHLNKDLQSIPLDQRIAVVKNLWVQLDDKAAEYPSIFSDTIRWSAGDQQRHITFRWGFAVSWLILSLWSLVWALLVSGLYVAIPAPMSNEKRFWLNKLQIMGYSSSQARSLTEDFVAPFPPNLTLWLNALVPKLPFDQALLLARAATKRDLTFQHLPWVLLGYQQHPVDLELALEVATATNELFFDVDRQCLRLHGVEISINQTPMFYYLWYALQRESGDGWVLNPSSQQADIYTAKDLVLLMKKYRGHPKAIAELEEQGLRAKTLDQNRSKIKEALTAALGDELSQQFLFESEKDRRTGRSRYRLMSHLSVAIYSS